MGDDESVGRSLTISTQICTIVKKHYNIFIVFFFKKGN